LESGVLFLRLQQAEEYVGGCMAKIIEFYIPQSFRQVSKWLLPNEIPWRRRIVRAEGAAKSTSLPHR
jgi:hypothetical protein